MPDWTNVVPPQPRGPALPIRRTPANGKMTAIVTSPDLIGCYTHFWHGSTVPCTLPDCPAHQENLPYRWHAYMTAAKTDDNLHFIFECTALAAKHFTDYRDKFGTLRGCLFEAKRWNSKPNSRILIRCKPCDLQERVLPAAPDLRKCMAILWSLPSDVVQTPRTHHENNMREIAIKLAKANGK